MKNQLENYEIKLQCDVQFIVHLIEVCRFVSLYLL